jgi:hypothetical protein
MGKLRLLLLAGIVISALGATAAWAQSPTLTAQLLTCGPGTDPIIARACPAGSEQPSITEAVCAEGGTGSFSYRVAGFATGPYSGTFVETGTATFGPLTPVDRAGFPGRLEGAPRTFVAEFTIESALGTITGRKLLPEPDELAFPESFGACQVMGGQAVSTGFFTLSGTVCYAARLPDGAIDRGTSTLTVSRTLAPGGEAFAEQFAETFTSDPTVTGCELLVPASKDECKDGGWRAFGVFKNQGDCVSFIATDGRNEPGHNVPKPAR